MRRVGWVLFALTCGLCAAETALVFAADVPFWSVDVLIGLGYPLVPIGAMLGSAVGALIISRYPRNAIGWLFAVGQLGSAIGILSDAAILYIGAGDDPGDPLPTIVVAGQLFNLIFVLTFLALVFLLVPDGHVLNRRWRFAPAVPIVALVIESVVILTIPPSDFAATGPVEFGALTTALVLVSNVLIGVAVVLGAISVRKRLRAASGEARQQLRWLAAAAVLLAAIYVLTFAGNALLAPDAPAALRVLIYLLLYLSYIFVFVAVGVAILRYRLYDIDVILSRAIVLAVLAVFVTVGYVAVVVAIGSLLSAIGTEESGLFWPSLVATALVATAFQPLRRHVLKLADRLVYGRRAVPYEALADLSRELADRPTPISLPARVAEATGRAVGAAASEAIVGPQPTPMTRATWTRGGAAGAPKTAGTPPASGAPRPPGTEVTVSIVDLGEEVGCVTVTMPPGRQLRDFERALLDDVGRQAGPAFRSALLEAELADHVRQIEHRSADLAASRGRLVRAEDGARERLAADIARRVVPQLSTVTAELENPGSAAELALRLDSLVALVETALDELRAVCRGVFPALLERRGLVPALAAELEKRPATTVEVGAYPPGRLDRAAEAAAYVFAVDVAPAVAAATVRVSAGPDALTVEVRVTGPWEHATGASGPEGAEGTTGTAAWQHARDRVAALDGTTVVTTGVGPDGRAGTTVLASIPLGDQRERDDDVLAQTASSRSGPNDDLGT